jgi:osmotically-inducible protein OsmY
LHNADIDIETRNGEVTLVGFVDVLAEKWAAGKIVQMIPGVVSVDNSLTVAIDRQLEDNNITELIQEKLIANQLANVTATVKAGTAYLEGRVEILAAEEGAKEIAAQVPGVKEVISYIKFEQGGFHTDDASVTNAVETELSRSTTVSARDVETSTCHGIVTLKGTVDTPAQKEAAVKIAAQVPGVKNINNYLNTRHGSGDSDYMLTNEIRNELGNHGLGGVRCFVVDRTAFLEGAVGSPDQKEKAEEVVGSFEGIEGINNDIQIS